ncbi:MAG: ThuA domain-containing protein [Flavobacteriaceae bacterium]
MKINILYCFLALYISYGCQGQASLENLYVDPSNTQTVLVLTATEGYVHKEAIPAGKELLIRLGKENGFNVLHARQSTALESVDFSSLDAMVFLCTTLDIFNSQQEALVKNYIQNGGGYVGIHAAADTEYDWPWYGQLVGAYFESHPEGTPRATLTTLETDTQFTNHLPASWSIDDEWYNYTFQNEALIPLLNLEESSYVGGTNGNTHPITWYHDFDGGRSFYTGLGHKRTTYEDPRFIQLLQKGLVYAMGQP